MKNNIKKAPVKFRKDLLYFQHFMLIFVFAAKILINSIVYENALNSEQSLMQYKGRPSNYLFQLFLTL